MHHHQQQQTAAEATWTLDRYQLYGGPYMICLLVNPCKYLTKVQLPLLRLPPGLWDTFSIRMCSAVKLNIGEQQGFSNQLAHLIGKCQG